MYITCVRRVNQIDRPLATVFLERGWEVRREKTNKQIPRMRGKVATASPEGMLVCRVVGGRCATRSRGSSDRITEGPEIGKQAVGSWQLAVARRSPFDPPQKTQLAQSRFDSRVHERCLTQTHLNRKEAAILLAVTVFVVAAMVASTTGVWRSPCRGI